LYKEIIHYMGKKIKEIVWHKKKSKMLSSKYLKETKSNLPTSNKSRHPTLENNSRAKDYACKYTEAIKKATK